MHVVAEMGAQSVVEILPALVIGPKLIAVVYSQQERMIEFLIVAVVAALHPAVVSLATLGVASELAVQGAKELF